MDNGPVIKKISSDGISPNLLRAAYFTVGMELAKGSRTQARYVYDYEMEYYTEADGAMVINDKVFPIKQGDIVLRKPGQLVQGVMPYNCYLIIFDMDGNTGKDSSCYSFEKVQPFQNLFDNPVINTIPHVHSSEAPTGYYKLFKDIYELSLSNEDTKALMIKSSILQILNMIYEEVKKKVIPQSPYYLVLKRVTDYIKQNLDRKIGLGDIASITPYSPNHLHKIFTQTFNMTLNCYINNMKLERAKRMLSSTVLPVYQVAIMCGFENIPYFSYRFKKYTGMSPRQFRSGFFYY